MFKNIVNKVFNNNEIDQEELLKDQVIFEALCAYKDYLVMDDNPDMAKLEAVDSAIHDSWSKLPLNA